MIKALIHIKAVQRADGNEDVLKMTSVGSFEKTDKGWQIDYIEIDEDNTETHVTVKTEDDTVMVIRKRGAISSVLAVQKQQLHQCVYETEYGNLMLGIFGRKVMYSLSEKGGFVKLVYAVDINGVYSSENEISLRIKSKEEK